jgi:hypothetical protein
MNVARIPLGRAARWSAALLGAAAAAYAAYVAVAWRRYGHVAPVNSAEQDDLLDRFMPVYDVVERHHARLAASSEVVLAAARDMDLQGSTVVHAIFKARELVLGAEPGRDVKRIGLVEQLTSMGWGVLAETPHEIVFGAATQPWLANVTFRSLPPDRFASFDEPGFVKIAWTLRADPISGSESIFRTETRAVTTDAVARSKFRWYWARFSPGIIVIRRMMLRQLRYEVDRRLTR